MSTFNKIIFVLSLIVTLVFWIGGIFMIGEIRHTLINPQTIGWRGVYFNLFKYISLPASIAFAAFFMSELEDIKKSILGYIEAFFAGFFLTIPFTIAWLVLMAILGFIGYVITFISVYS